MVELALVAKARVSQSQEHDGIRVEGLVLPLPAVVLGKLAGAVLKSSPWCCGCGRAGRLTNPTPTQAIQHIELVHPNIYPTYELLEV